MIKKLSTTKGVIIAFAICTAVILAIVFVGNSWGGPFPAAEKDVGAVSVLDSSISLDAYHEMLKHTARTGKLEQSGKYRYISKRYFVGWAVPKHGTMPHELWATFIAIPNWLPESGVLISLKYSRDMGDELRGHTMLYMNDTDFDGKPNNVIRRVVVSDGGRIYVGAASKMGIIKDTYVFNFSLPTDIPEWNDWLSFFYERFKEEGADLP